MSASILSTALAWSPSLQRLLQGNPGFGDWLEQASLEPVTPERLKSWFEELSGNSLLCASLDIPTCRKLVRQLRQRTFFSLMVRDLAGIAALEEVVVAMSALADLCVEQAYRCIMAELVATHGIPRDPLTGLPQEMIIVGMGKLGGFELNVSSDIDLIMLYGEEGETNGPRPISHHEFYSKLTRNMMPVISEPDGDGQVFRTDLRLRPNGDSGALAWSLDAFEQYLFTQGREWERYAWLKARVMPARAFADSDTRAAIQQLESMRLPFVYRKYFDFDALRALRDLREKIRQDWQRRALARPGLDTQNNIKLGEGGIREIEFVVQLSQLIRGGRMQSLQQRGLLDALQAQKRAGILKASTCERLADAYCFLRRTEHALQYFDDAQTHMLPSDPVRMTALAAAMHLTPEQFNQTLTAHCKFVSDTFRDAFRLAGIGEDTDHAQLPPGSSGAAATSATPGVQGKGAEPDSSLEEIIAHFGQDATELTRRVESFLDSHRVRTLSVKSRARVDSILPIAFRAALHTPSPMTAALKLLDLVEGIAQRSAYLALLAEYPETMARIARMMAASPWAALYLIQHPLVLDRLIAWRTLMEPLDFVQLAQTMRADLDLCLLGDGSADIEQQMNLMRDTQRQISFQLLAQDLEGVLTVEKLADQLSALADMLLAETIARVWPMVEKADANGLRAAPQLAIIAYGRLGGKELGYSSDLDLVFLYEDAREDAAQVYAKLGQRISSWLSTMTSSGRLYEIDLRLRPDGAAGLIAVSVQAFETYQLEHAWPWEHQALTRARFAAGDARVGRLFEQVRQKVLTVPRDRVLFAGEVRAMREKMLLGHPNNTPDFDLKHDRGGMVDLEFVTQYLVLLHAREQPELIGNLGNIALLKLAGQAGLIDMNLAVRASNAYRNLRRLQHALRLKGAEKARIEPAQVAEEREAIGMLWDSVLGKSAN